MEQEVKISIASRVAFVVLLTQKGFSTQKTVRQDVSHSEFAPLASSVIHAISSLSGISQRKQNMFADLIQ